MGNKNFLKGSLIVAAAATATFAILPKVEAASIGENRPSISYCSHVQNKGWMPTIAGDTVGNFTGTTGESKRLEAVKISFKGPSSVKLMGNAHVQNEGWIGWKEITNETMIGTEGESKRLEAIKLSVEGLEGFVIKYRAHVQGIGWQDWVTANSSQQMVNFAGTQGQSKRIEALEIVVLSEEENDLFIARQKALKSLQSYVNVDDYKINKKSVEEAITAGEKAINAEECNDEEKISKALETAQKAINDILSDSDIEEKIALEEEDLDKWVKTYLNKAIGNNEEKYGKYIDQTSIQEAVEKAKEEFKGKEEYKTADFLTTPGEGTAPASPAGPLGLEARRAVTNATKEYVEEFIETLYASGKNEEGKILSKTNYETLLNSLKEASTLNNIIDVIKDVDTQFIEMEEVIQYWKETVFDAEFASTFEQDIESKDDKVKELLKNGETKYADIGNISSIKAKADADLDKASSYEEINSIIDKANASMVEELKAFIERFKTELTKQGVDNTAGYILSSKTIREELDPVMNKTDVTADELITAYEAAVTAATEFRAE